MRSADAILPLMGEEAEAPGEVLAGSIGASAIEGNARTPAQIDAQQPVALAQSGAQQPGALAQTGAHGACRNCGALLNGRYCSACAQPAHIHRSLGSLGHDILHGVFHFEGRIWRTLPELFFHPGRLTRRYIDGERASFVSPMALFLFTVFLMFAVFSITGGVLMDQRANPAADSETNLMTSVPGDWKSSLRRSIREADREIESLGKQLSAVDVSPERRATLEREIGDVQSAREAMGGVAKKAWSRLAQLDGKSKSTANAAPEATAQEPKAADAAIQHGRDNEPRVELGWPALDSRLTAGLRQLNEDPELLLYKLKSNGYKFSWALIPLSVPFMWLMFFWRRDIYLYDHAIFVTYSISFVMLLLVLLSIGAAAGRRDIWQTAMVFVPPIHLYSQLRGAYGVSRFGAWVRLCLLEISIAIVLGLFSILLLLFGVLD